MGYSPSPDHVRGLGDCLDPNDVFSSKISPKHLGTGRCHLKGNFFYCLSSFHPNQNPLYTFLSNPGS